MSGFGTTPSRARESSPPDGDVARNASGTVGLEIPRQHQFAHGSTSTPGDGACYQRARPHRHNAPCRDGRAGESVPAAAEHHDVAGYGPPRHPGAAGADRRADRRVARPRGDLAGHPRGRGRAGLDPRRRAGRRADGDRRGHSSTHVRTSARRPAGAQDISVRRGETGPGQRSTRWRAGAAMAPRPSTDCGRRPGLLTRADVRSDHDRLGVQKRRPRRSPAPGSTGMSPTPATEEERDRAEP